MKEFCLSEKEVDNYNGIDMGSEFFFKEDVKEFIRLLLDNCSFCVIKEDEEFMKKQIIKRAGKKLTLKRN